MTTSEPLRADESLHSILERDHPNTFADACRQAWPDADAYALLGGGLVRLFDRVWR